MIVIAVIVAILILVGFGATIADIVGWFQRRRAMKNALKEFEKEELQNRINKTLDSISKDLIEESIANDPDLDF